MYSSHLLNNITSLSPSITRKILLVSWCLFVDDNPVCDADCWLRHLEHPPSHTLMRSASLWTTRQMGRAVTGRRLITTSQSSYIGHAPVTPSSWNNLEWWWREIRCLTVCDLIAYVHSLSLFSGLGRDDAQVLYFRKQRFPAPGHKSERARLSMGLSHCLLLQRSRQSLAGSGRTGLGCVPVLPEPASPCAVLMLGQRRRRRPSIKTTQEQCFIICLGSTGKLNTPAGKTPHW